MELQGLPYLKNKLANKSARVNRRYAFYDMKNKSSVTSSIIPAEFKNWQNSIGWCAKAVDTLADRIVFDSFGNDIFKLQEIYAANNPDILFDSAILSALISSCSFIYIGRSESGYVQMQVVDGGSATGIIDPVTNLMTEGYAVLERDRNNKPTLEAYFRPYQTDYYVDGVLDESKAFVHNAPYALLVPIINRPDAKRPFGHSRISRACMDITQAVLRTMLRMDVASEFYSAPQKYILGLSETAEFNNRAATLSNFLSFEKDEDGGHPTVGQFQQQSMAPFSEQLKSYASIFAGETGLTIEDLGFSTSNPSSSEAIRASHENLRLTARKAQRTFATGFINAGYLAACVRDSREYDRNAFVSTTIRWMPIFEPDANGLGALGDAIYKINQAVPDFLGENSIMQFTGLRPESDI